MEQTEDHFQKWQREVQRSAIEYNQELAKRFPTMFKTKEPESQITEQETDE